MFQYCLFDLDGTLTDPKEGITRSVQHALKHFGIEEPDLDRLEPFIGPPLKDSFMEFYGLSEEQALKAVEVYRERFAPIGGLENEIIPGTGQMLAHAREKGIHLAVASSKPLVFVRQILRHFQIEDYFEVVVGSELDGTRGSKEEVGD
ncbi:MAG: HAD hydrolase-like protein, partial [Lachnospiraceae bacterium]|nr:HAD hydrolase-like protein [Lachnospiraceae bacterium]